MINSRQPRYLPVLTLSLASALLAAACVWPTSTSAQGFATSAVRSTRSSKPKLVTLDRARQALQLAKLAAENKMTGLSLRAVRDSLASGPPVQPIAISRNRISSGSAQNAQTTQYITEVETAIRELNTLWKAHKFPPQEVYESLRKVVLPDTRPDETFLYAKLLSSQFNKSELKQPRSVGKILAEWAVAAKQTDDLKQRLLQRAAKPKGQVEAWTLLTQLELEKGNSDGVNSGLAKLTELIKQNSLKHTAEIACHAALPASDSNATAAGSVELIEKLLGSLPDSNSSSNYQAEPNSSLLLLVAGSRFKSGDTEQGLAHVERFLQTNQANNNRHSGDYGIYMRQHQLAAASDVLMAGKQIDKAFQYIGEAADISTRYSYDPLGSGRSNRLINHLGSLDAAARYKYLHDWCMPKKNRRNLRHISGASFAAIPPKVFRDKQGPNPLVNTGDRIVSSAKSLVDAAQELGKLDELIEELKPNVEKKVEKTASMLALSLIAAGRLDEAKPLVKQIQEEVLAASKKKDRSRDAWLDFQVGSAWAQAVPAKKGEKVPSRLMVLDPLTKLAQNTYKSNLLNEINMSKAISTQIDRGIKKDVLALAKPVMWTSGSIGAYDRSATWIAHEGHISHIHGPGNNDALYFNFPLAGEFEFSIDCLDDGWAESDIAFGAVSAVDHSYTSRVYVHSPRGTQRLQKTAPSLARRTDFVRKSVRVTKDSVTHLINGHPVYVDENPDGFAASPWLELVGTDYRKTIFRNPRLTGNVTIPQELSLSADAGLRGWLAGSSSQQANPLPAPDEDSKNWTAYRPATSPTWTWQDGEIIGQAQDNASPDGTVEPRWLQYVRPMQNGDNISWEFNHIPGKEVVHPSLGRMAYELDRSGVQLRWYLFPEHGPENRVKVEKEQRGEVPLTEGWNQAQLAIEGDTVLLKVNGQLVYEHPLEANEERQFGFYHNYAAATARVRNVKLKGNWPTRLTENHIASLASRGPAELNMYEARSLGSTIGEHFIARHPIDVMRHAYTIEDKEQRFAYLYDYVMPGVNHWYPRTGGDLTPANPAPPIRDVFAKSGEGGQIVAPLFELIDLAKELGRLEELVKRFEVVVKSHARDGHAAIALAYMAMGNTRQAITSFDEVERRTLKSKDFSLNRRWAEVLMVSRLNDDPDADPQLVASAFRIMHAILHKQILNGREGNRAWAQHVRALHTEMLNRMLANNSSQQTVARLKHWTPVTHPRSETNGTGMPAAQFRLTPAGELAHGAGFDEDYVYFDVPLTGDFEVECELTSFDWREMSIGYGGILVEPHHSKEKVRVIKANRAETMTDIDSNLKVGTWYRYRIAVKDNTMTCFIDDDEVYETELPANRDPWLYVRSVRWTSGAIRNLKITGAPEVPTEFAMSGDENLTGWSSRYFGDSIGPKTDPDKKINNDWSFGNGRIRGRRSQKAAGGRKESILQYHRPMLEDGVIEYMFPRKPGTSMVHPALGKCVFYLTDEKVRIHWLTDGKYDRTGLDPGNMYDEPEHQLVDKLPLQPQNNILRIELKGDTATIVLNGTPVFRRPMEPDNQRQFGLFHFKGESQVFVKNVVWKEAAWPKELPPASEQPFGKDPVASLLASVADLKAEVVCDFTSKSPQDMNTRPFSPEYCQPSENGLKLTCRPNGDWNPMGVQLAKGVEGDFDIIMDFTDLEISKPEKNASWLRMSLEPEQSRISTWSGVRVESGKQALVVERNVTVRDGTGIYEPHTMEITTPPTSGRLRYIRSGAELWVLFAPEKSEAFTFIESFIIGSNPIPPGKLQANVLTSDPKAPTSVTLKRITIKADGLL